MYQLIESIKVEHGMPQNISWHQKRMDFSYMKSYGQKCKFDIESIINEYSFDKETILKLRFLYNDNTFKIESSPYIQRAIKTLKIVVDNSINYNLKLANRECLNNLTEQKNDCDDILIVKNNYITDSSFSNIIFFDGNSWITPSTPLLKGTCRERLIANGIIFEREIKLKDLAKFDKFMLINAMLDVDTNRTSDITNIIY